MEIRRLDESVLTQAEKDEALRQLRCQVWWLSIPFYWRWLYWLKGYRAPITDFYSRPSSDRLNEFVEIDVMPLWRRLRGR